MSKSDKSQYPKDPSYQQPQGHYYPSAPQAYPSAPLAPPAYSVVPGAQPPPPYAYQPGPASYPVPYPQQPNYNVTMTPQYPQGPTNYNPGYPVQQGFQYQATGPALAHFDDGARFDGIASPNIPPPPPGCAPNAAQMAASQGRPVVGTQKKAGWFSGGSGGGVSFW